MPGKRRPLRQDSKFELPLVYMFAVCVPAVIELAFILVRPFFRNVVRGVVGAGRKIQEEWFIGRYLFAIGNELNGFVGEVFGEVITLLWCFRRINLMVIVNQVWIILMRVTAKKSVVTLETSAQRPTVIRACGAGFRRGGEVPFADAERRITMLQENFRQESIFRSEEHTSELQ